MATTTTEAPLKETLTDASQTAVQKLREQADAVVQKIQPQIAAVSTFAREEPTKALLISAATGAALMGLIAMIVRSGNRSPASQAQSLGAAAMAAIRDAALDLADSAQSMAADALDATKKRATDAYDAAHKRASSALDDAQKRASSAYDDAQKRAGSTTDSVASAATDAWEKVRDQAAPYVDKVRPQVEAATKYVKDDPARAAIGLAVAGAVVAGLLALVRTSDDD